MTDEVIGSERFRKELDYYKRQLDELTGENVKLDITISGLRRELKQKKQGFALLSELQQSIGVHKQISSIFEITIRAINHTLGMDKTAVLMPTDKENTYRPSQWLGFHEESAEQLSSLSFEFPPDFAEGTGFLVVNKSSEKTPLIEKIQAAFDLPYFICLPVMLDKAPIGLLLSGRLVESEPLFPPLDQGDVDTFQAIAGLISACVRNLQVAVLQEMDRLKTEFFANISHEFRTPITLTLGPLEGILTERYGEVPDAIRDQALVMQRNQERLLGLIDQILDLAKLEAGGMQLKAAPIPDMNRFVEERVGQFRSMAEERGIELRVSLDPRVRGADLFIDREKFDKLLLNLLSNALKFTKQGHVEVCTEIYEGTFRLAVNDTGIGIKADQIPYIFDRFRQADGSASREYAGTGIGLAWVKEIAELHGGDVVVYSQYGSGSSFRVSLPLGKAHLDPASVVEFVEEELPALAGPHKVLIVSEGATDQEGVDHLNEETEASFDPETPTVLYAEDNHDMRNYVRELLSAHYNVFLAVDGRDGIEKARTYKPDLILADHMMPHMSGRDLLREVRTDPELRSIPVIFLTARAGTEARVESLSAGADDYLTKPFDEEELLVRIRNPLRARAQERELAEINRRLEARIEEQMAELVRSGELKRFLPQGVVESLLKGELGVDRECERRKITVLFIDLVGFTSLTGRIEPEELLLFLNEFLCEMTSVAVAHGGTVVQLTGDALMVIFGAPRASEGVVQARSSVQAAIAMRARIQDLAVHWRRRGISQELDVRIGINTGYCTVGIFGSDLLQSYTAYGTPVNIAVLLQSEAAVGEILCGFSTYALVQDRVRAEARAPLSLRGIAHPVEVYAILGLVDQRVVSHGEESSTRRIIAHRFEISDLEKDLLGRGAMGDVYRGTDTETGQAVAIKALKPEIVASNPDIVARFIREGEALRQLNHPNIVKMVAAVEEDGRHYLSMEYVAGGSLRDLLEQQGPLSIARVVEIGLDLADALTRAHRLGIIHRDLKPANVLLAEDGTPRLTDFGHAHMSASPRLTETGMVLGTVDYLSPEACQGEQLDARADIWALGVMLYEMLAGGRPFMGETLPAIVMAILTQPVPDLASLCPDAPDALVNLVYRMLEKDPHQRIPSVRLAGAELEAILAGESGRR